MDTLATATQAPVERFVLAEVRRAERPTQGHREVSVTGTFELKTLDLAVGSIVVRTDQPLGRLVFYLLEPDSDDSLTTWNLLDAALSAGAAHPVLKTMPGYRLETRPLP